MQKGSYFILQLHETAYSTIIGSEHMQRECDIDSVSCIGGCEMWHDNVLV